MTDGKIVPTKVLVNRNTQSMHLKDCLRRVDKLVGEAIVIKTCLERALLINASISDQPPSSGVVVMQRGLFNSIQYDGNNFETVKSFLRRCSKFEVEERVDKEFCIGDKMIAIFDDGGLYARCYAGNWIVLGMGEDDEPEVFENEDFMQSFMSVEEGE